MLPMSDTGPVVVLFSGGLDSTVLAHMAGDRLAALLSFSYWQPNAVHELLAAERWAVAHKAKREVVALPLRGVASAMAIGAGSAGARVLPGRNLVMLAHGVNLAASIGAREVWYGATLDDDRNYPDCRASFVSWVNMAAGAYGVIVRAPLIGCSKSDVVRHAVRLGVDIGATWSCYEADTRTRGPCGTCNACVLRATALEVVGV